MKKTTITSLISSVIIAYTLFGCGLDDDLIPNELDDLVLGDSSLIRVEKNLGKIRETTGRSSHFATVGDTVVVFREPKVHVPPLELPDLNGLKGNGLSNQPLSIKVVGELLSSGFRDGGYFNEGIATSYVSILSRQLRANIGQPYFLPEDYNGSGRLFKTNFNPTEGPVPKFYEVSNNLGIKQTMTTNSGKEFFVLKEYSRKGIVDNYAAPDLHTQYLNPYFAREPVAEVPFMKRLVSSNGSLLDQFFNQKFDFIVVQFGELAFHDFLQGKVDPTGFAAPYAGVFEEHSDRNKYLDNPVGALSKFFWRLKDEEITKGCILNLYDVSKLPYYNKITLSEVNSVISQDKKAKQITGVSLVLPTSEIDSLLSVKVSMALKKGVMDNPALSEKSFVMESRYNDKDSFLENYNNGLADLAKYLSIPVVDIQGLYNEILEGHYLTEDGILVNPEWLKGNFFSADGMNPTPFGQAIIANEVIKTINGFYHTEIPLIETRFYLNN